MEYFNSKNKIIYQSTIVMIIMGKSKISFKINVKIPNNFGQDLNILNEQSEDLNQMEMKLMADEAKNIPEWGQYS